MFSEIASAQIRIVSYFGDYIFLVFIISLLIIGFLFYKKYYATLLAFILVHLSYPTSVLLKNLFRHKRPQSADFNTFLEADKYSFPSSHVVFYTVYWGFLFYLTIKYQKTAKLSFHILRWICLYMVLSIGASRIFVGAHFLADVLFGYFIGLIYLGLLIILDKKNS